MEEEYDGVDRCLIQNSEDAINKYIIKHKNFYGHMSIVLSPDDLEALSSGMALVFCCNEYTVSIATSDSK